MAIIDKKEREGKITVDITGPQGNAYWLIGYAGKLAKQLDWDYKKISKQKSKLEKQEAKTNRLLGDEVTANISKMFDTMRKEQLERDARSKYLDELLRQKEERDRESQTPKKLKIGVKRINETETAIKNQEKTIKSKKKQILNEQEYLNSIGSIKFKWF